MRVLVIGLSRELPLGQVDAVELADQLVKRAASLCLDGKGHFHQAMSISQYTNVYKMLSKADNIHVLQNPISSSREYMYMDISMNIHKLKLNFIF